MQTARRRCLPDLSGHLVDEVLFVFEVRDHCELRPDLFEHVTGRSARSAVPWHRR